MLEEVIRENFWKIFFGSKQSTIKKQKERICDLNNLEKSVYLIHLYLDKGKSIELCMDIFETTKDILEDFFMELNILNKQNDFKLCTKCYNIKPSTTNFFYSYKSSLDGLNARCIKCHMEYFDENEERMKKNRKRWGENNKERIHDYNIEYVENNIEYYKQYAKKYNEEHKEQVKIQNLKYNTENKESIKAQNKIYRDKNISRVLAWNAKRRGLRINATPSWVNLEEIDKIYAEAKRLEKNDGIKRHVDHIIPLTNPLVCGLHVHQNLQILTMNENITKSNKFVPYILNENGIKIK